MNFVHQKEIAISIGIYENGIGKIGLIYDPVHDELYHAVKGSGAFVMIYQFLHWKKEL